MGGVGVNASVDREGDVLHLLVELPLVVELDMGVELVLTGDGVVPTEFALLVERGAFVVSDASTEDHAGRDDVTKPVPCSVLISG